MPKSRTENLSSRPDAPTSTRSMHRESTRPLLLLLALVCATGALFFAAACGPQSPRPANPAPLTASSPPSASTAAVAFIPFLAAQHALTPEEAQNYVGDRACAPCHTDLVHQQSQSRHAHTFRRVTITQDGPAFQSRQTLRDPQTGYAYSVTVQNGRCLITGNNGQTQASLAADWVMGAGHNAHTFFHESAPDAWLELRATYYTHLGKWSWTPQQLPGANLVRAAGRDQVGDQLTQCLLCHVTALRAAPYGQGPDVAKSHLGIGCERCHGPGKTHIAAVSNPALSPPGTHLAMETLGKASPARINALCGECHRTSENAPDSDPHTEIGVPRFQGVALARSKCYRNSNALSCVTCHDPHRDADTNLVHNDSICLRCHASASAASAQHAALVPAVSTASPLLSVSPAKATGFKRVACPVNPRRDCTRCHMPRQQIADIPYAKYTNHWIKVWKPM